MRPSAALGTLSALVAASGYGLAYVVARMAYDYGLNSFTLNTLRFLALAIIVAVWIALARGDYRLPRASFAITLLMGVLITAAGITNFASIAYIPVSLAVLIFYTYPLVTLILNSIVERRTPAPVEYLAFLCAFAGLTLVLQVSVVQLNTRGVALALAGALTAGAHLVAAQHAMRAAGFRVVVLYMSLSAFMLTGLMTWGFGQLALPSPGRGMWLLGCVVAAFCVGMAALLAGVRMIGPVRTSIVMCMEPPLVIGFAYLLLGERLGAVQLLGSLLVIAAVVIAQTARPRTAST